MIVSIQFLCNTKLLLYCAVLHSPHPFTELEGVSARVLVPKFQS